MSNYIIFAIIPFLFGLYAQFKIKSAYSKWASVRTQTGITGFEAARTQLAHHGVHHIKSEPVH